jgi:hypothetical protein
MAVDLLAAIGIIQPARAQARLVGQALRAQAHFRQFVL